MHLRFVVPHAGENYDWHVGVNLANKPGQSYAVDLGHFEIDDDDLAIVVREPGSGFESVGERIAGMTFLPQVSDQEAGNAWVIIDDEELGRGSLREDHPVL